MDNEEQLKELERVLGSLKQKFDYIISKNERLESENKMLKEEIQRLREMKWQTPKTAGNGEPPCLHGEFIFDEKSFTKQYNIWYNIAKFNALMLLERGINKWTTL